MFFQPTKLSSPFASTCHQLPNPTATMDEITVPSFRCPLSKGSIVPGRPELLIGKKIGTSLYTWNHIYECLQQQHQQQQQQTHPNQHQQARKLEDSELAIKASV